MTDTPLVVPPPTAEPNQRVVHLPHLELVKRSLAENGTPVTATLGTDERLGLALLEIKGTDSIEPVVKALRATLERAYHGWVPLVGKNRHLTSVIGLAETKPHAEGPPVVPQARPTPAQPGVGRGVRVGIADSSVTDHPDLVGRFIADESAWWSTTTSELNPVLA